MFFSCRVGLVNGSLLRSSIFACMVNSGAIKYTPFFVFVYIINRFFVFLSLLTSHFSTSIVRIQDNNVLFTTDFSAFTLVMPHESK